MKIDLDKVYKILNFPLSLRDATVSKIPEKCPHKPHVLELVISVKEFLQRGENLFLYGDFGTGKSAIAAIFLKAALSHGEFGLWINHYDLISKTMNGAMYDEETTFSERAEQVPLLVIDEVIFRAETKQREYMIEMLVRSRLEKGRSTIITTNHNLDYFEKTYRSLHSVIAGHYHLLEVKGHNFRI